MFTAVIRFINYAYLAVALEAMETMEAMDSAADIAAMTYDFPPDLAAWRQRLFDLSNESINISEAEYASYMPYVDNVWSRKEKVKNTEYFRCRRWRKELEKPKTRVGARAKLSRDKIECGMTMMATHL